MGLSSSPPNQLMAHDTKPNLDYKKKIQTLFALVKFVLSVFAASQEFCLTGIYRRTKLEQKHVKWNAPMLERDLKTVALQLAVQLSAQVPDDHAEACQVIHYLKELVDCWLYDDKNQAFTRDLGLSSEVNNVTKFTGNAAISPRKI